MIRVLYITRARLSFSRAHARNIVKTAEYLNQEPDCAAVVFSSAAEPQGKNFIFEAKRVMHPFPLDVASCKRSLLLAVFQLRTTYDILYYRDPRLLFVACTARFFLRKRVVFEVHGSHEWRFFMFAWYMAVFAAHGLIFITKALQSYYCSSKPSLVVHTNSIEEADMAVVPRVNFRGELGIPSDATICMYAGNLLWDSKEILFSMTRALPSHVVLVLVGIREDEIEKTFKEAEPWGVRSRIFIVPRVSSKEYMSYIKAADILINPLSLSYPGSVSSKLYEYLAAGKPIITSAGGANREVITDGESGVVADPPTGENFAFAVQKIMNDSSFAEHLSKMAKERSKTYTWNARGDAIADFITKLT